MTKWDWWILRAVAVSALVVMVVFGYEVYSNGEQAKKVQIAIVNSAKSGSGDIHQLSSSAVTATNGINTATGKLSDTIDSLNWTIQTINRPCLTKSKDGKSLPCGTLADVADTLHTVRGTFGVIEVAGHHFDQNLAKVDSQQQQLFDDAHGLLVNAAGTTKGLGDLAGSLKTTSDDVQKRLNDPEVDKFMVSLNSTMDHVDGISADAQYKAHQLLHPDKKKLTFWAGTQATVQWIHSNLIPPLF